MLALGGLRTSGWEVRPLLAPADFDDEAAPYPRGRVATSCRMALASVVP